MKPASRLSEPFNRAPRDIWGRWRDRCRVAQWTVDADELAYQMRPVDQSCRRAALAVESFHAVLVAAQETDPE